MPAMRKIVMFASALMVIGVGTWAIASAPRVAASTTIGIDPLQMMANAQELRSSDYDF